MPRARITQIRPVARDVVQATTAQMRRIADNPNTHTITDLTRVGPGYVQATITRVTAPVRPRRRLPVTVTLDPQALTVARRAVTAAAVITAVPAALFGAGWLTWELWGQQITHALGIFLGSAAVILSLIALAWVLSSKAGICAGIHCPGCPHGK
jgi:hypothetical protein